MRSGPVLLLGVAALLASCSRAPDAASGVTIADSAGVKIVTSGARDSVLPWVFEEVDVLRDSLGEPYLFQQVWWFTVLTDRAGRTYVLTRDPGVVRFGRDGRQERTFGRQGRGPGEFMLPTGMGSMGDTIWVMDIIRRSLVRFGPDFEPVDDRALTGALTGAEMLIFRQGGAWFRRTTYDSSGTVVEVIADTLTGAPIARTYTPPGRAVRFDCGVGLPAGMTIFAPEVMFQGNGPRIVLNTQPAYDVRLYEGPRLIASVRRPIAPRAPTAEDVALLYPDGMRFGLGPGQPECRVPVPELMTKLGTAASMPLVFDVTLLRDGSIWVLRTPHQAEPVVDVFGPDGAYRGTMRGRPLPLAQLPNGELLFAREDSASGGKVIARVRVGR